jgi:hypothetical protein
VVLLRCLRNWLFPKGVAHRLGQVVSLDWLKVFIEWNLQNGLGISLVGGPALPACQCERRQLDACTHNATIADIALQISFEGTAQASISFSQERQSLGNDVTGCRRVASKWSAGVRVVRQLSPASAAGSVGSCARETSRMRVPGEGDR